jgi:hypothetical protein
MSSTRFRSCIAAAVCAAAVSVVPAHADRAYVHDSLDLLGDLTVARISDDGTRLTFLSARVQVCTHGTTLSDSFRIVRRRPTRLPNWKPVLVAHRIRAGGLDARVLRRIRYDDGVESWNGRLTLRRITGRSVQGVWSIAVKWAPRGGPVRRCSTRASFRMNHDGDWYVGNTKDDSPVAIHAEGSSVYSLIAYWADCKSGDFVSALYGEPLALTAGDFGWTDPMEYIIQALDFNPATVIVNGHLDETRASGNFNLTVVWNGTDRCVTGAQSWTAERG